MSSSRRRTSGAAVCAATGAALRRNAVRRKLKRGIVLSYSASGRACAYRRLPFWEHPIRPDEVTGIAIGIILEIVLMLGLGLPERAGGCHLGDDFSRPETRGVDIGNRILGDAPLFVVRVEDRRTVAGADVVPLSIPGGRVVDLKKELEQLAVGDFLRIENDLDSFGVGAVVSIRRVGNISASVSHAGADYAGLFADQILDSPKA